MDAPVLQSRLHWMQRKLEQHYHDDYHSQHQHQHRHHLHDCDHEYDNNHDSDHDCSQSKRYHDLCWQHQSEHLGFVHLWKYGYKLPHL